MTQATINLLSGAFIFGLIITVCMMAWKLGTQEARIENLENKIKDK